VKNRFQAFAFKCNLYRYGSEGGSDDDGDAYGDFEDLETGEKFSGGGANAPADGDDDEDGEDGSDEDEDGEDDGVPLDDPEEERRRQEKIAKKEDFMSNGDGKGGGLKKKGGFGRTGTDEVGLYKL
jgi:hypothetical protein